jgi:hypothetical protein
VDVIHHFEKEEGKGDVDVGRIDEFIECIVIELFDEMVEKNFITVHLMVISIFKFISFEVKELH